ncbi:bifunctional diguanylate cyclase/phosphodiesterase [Acidithiobacillus thiooxidans]|uniref:Putative signaling protein n=1 Tax=Acidithiobacillus thiooxidans ATCC 19377 TaxID=637390 RepID=A0A543Q571_ACITH|nr:EAL domain-containing protein [Acidithiobacillus thiooxidans]MDX5934416.1 EAL domain-containing protein [Acidithiobacillus thiooxidans]TQN51471.1 putative signaling protein [Acidithiobacillus thiooxidans ATCC 19377]
MTATDSANFLVLNTLLTKTHQAISGAEDESVLLQHLCEIAVQQAGLKLAFVSRPDTQGRFQFLAAAGQVSYLKDLFLSCDALIPEGQGPAARSWREGRVYFDNNFAKAPFLAPWKEHALAYGLTASATLPVFHDGKVWAVLSVYSGEGTPFDEALQTILQQLSLQISQGLERLHDVQKLRFLRASVEALDSGVTIADPQRHFIYANQAFLKLTGYTEEEVLGHDCKFLQSPQTDAQTVRQIAIALAQEQSYTGEILNQRKDGALFWNRLHIDPILNDQGTLTGFIGLQQDITQERENRNLLQTLQDNAAVGIMVVRQRHIVQCNQNMADMMGLSLERMIGQDTRLLYADEANWERVGQAYAELFQTGTTVVRRIAFSHADQQPLLIDAFGTLLEDQETSIWTVVDVTESVQQAQQLRKQQDIYQALAVEADLLLQGRDAQDMLEITCTKLVDMGIFHTIGIVRPDPQGRVQVLAGAGPGVEKMQPFQIYVDDPSCLSARAWREQKTILHSDFSSSQANRPWGQILATFGWSSALATPVWRDGKPFAVITFISTEPVFDSDTITACERAASLLEHSMDEYDLKERLRFLQEQAVQIARTDLITGLPNRRFLDIQMEQSMARAERHDQLLAVCMLDLDGFKPVNDTYGHQAGDEVLATLGKRLPEALRKSDFVARLGGDEFVLLLEDLQNLNDLASILKKVEDTITAPIALSHGASVQIGASMGVALYPSQDMDTGDNLLRLADQALYESKKNMSYRERFWVLFGEDILANRRNPAQILLDRGGLEVWYQPILDSHKGKIVGIEALARLRDADGKIWPPAQFLPLLQGEDFSDLNKQVLTQALKDLSMLDAQGWPLWVAVNLDPRSLSGSCITCLREILGESTVDASRITLEILEGEDFLERQTALELLQKIKALGFRLALDDVGSAYNSLLRMKDLPIDEIKLDQGFVRTLEQRPQDLHFLGTIQDLATGMKVDLVVEGVETEDILDAVTVMGSTLLQGYAIAKPMPFSELQGFLKHTIFPHQHRPNSLLGLYAARLGQHEALKKTITRSPRAVDYLTLDDATACPLHGDIHRLVRDNVNRLDHLHREYHRAIAVMDGPFLASQSGADWSAVDQAMIDFEQAIVETYFEEKSKKRQTS